MAQATSVIPLRLENTYWAKGFFNVPVRFERLIAPNDGPIEIYLGNSSIPVRGRIDRRANLNNTPRIHGNKPLRDFFQKFAPLSVVHVTIEAPNTIRVTT